MCFVLIQQLLRGKPCTKLISATAHLNRPSILLRLLRLSNIAAFLNGLQNASNPYIKGYTMAHIHTLENGQLIIRDDWGMDDIQSVAECNFDVVLTGEQIKHVMDLVVEGFDANYGINWDSIDGAIRQVLKG